jgi:hypothetical protein
MPTRNIYAVLLLFLVYTSLCFVASKVERFAPLKIDTKLERNSMFRARVVWNHLSYTAILRDDKLYFLFVNDAKEDALVLKREWHEIDHFANLGVAGGSGL